MDIKKENAYVLRLNEKEFRLLRGLLKLDLNEMLKLKFNRIDYHLSVRMYQELNWKRE